MLTDITARKPLNNVSEYGDMSLAPVSHEEHAQIIQEENLGK